MAALSKCSSLQACPAHRPRPASSSHARVAPPAPPAAAPVASTSASATSSSSSSSSHRGRPAARLVARSAAPDATGAPAGQLSAALVEAMQAKITDALEAASVEVSDVYGDGRHVNISVVSSAFEGKTSVQRQRMVYKAIWLELQDAVHAVDSMSTKTPAEAA